jgi:ribosome-associated protein
LLWHWTKVGWFVPTNLLYEHNLRSEVRFEAVLSRGPGGQNVNRTASAAQMYWEFENSWLLNADEKARVRSKLANMINSEGLIYLRADEFRDLERNKSRCIEKLIAHVMGALHVPKKRKKTKPTWSSRVKRREQKSRRGEVKKNRRRISGDD